MSNEGTSFFKLYLGLSDVLTFPIAIFFSRFLFVRERVSRIISQTFSVIFGTARPFHELRSSHFLEKIVQTSIFTHSQETKLKANRLTRVKNVGSS